MVHILFDFELDTSLPRPYSESYYKTIRSFYLKCYKQHDALIKLLEYTGHFPVMVLSFVEEGIQCVPIDIPVSIANHLHKTISVEALEELEQALENLGEL